MLATRGAPPLGIFWSVSDKKLSESVVFSRSLRFHWELQSRDVSNQPSWIVLSQSLLTLNIEVGPGVVAQACNPSTLGG